MSGSQPKDPAREFTGGPVVGPDQELRIVLMGPFLIGLDVDLGPLSPEAAAQVQMDLVAALDAGDDAWGSGGLPTATGGLRYDIRAYETLSPTSLVRWVGDPSIAMPSLGDTTLSWTPQDLAVDIFAFGVGVFSVEFVVSAAEPVATTAFTEEVDRVSRQIATAAAPIADHKARELRHALDVACTEVTRTAWYHGVAQEQQSLPGADLLWLHRLMLIRTPDGRLPALAWEISGLLQASMRFHAFEFLAATDRSVAASGESADATDTVGEDCLKRVMRLQWAWFAAASEVDRALYLQLGKVGSDTQTLAADLTAARELLDRVRQWRARLDSVMADLGGVSIAMWDHLATTSKVTHLFVAIDDKLSALTATLQGRLEVATATRQRKLDRTVYVFTTFNVVASLVAVASFTIGDTTVFDPTRLGAVILATLASMMLVLASRR